MLEGGASISSSLLPIILLVISMATSIVMGLKLRWFRARINMASSRDTDNAVSMAGVYRSQNELPSLYGSVYESQPFQTVDRSYHTGPLKSERIASNSQGKQSNELPSVYGSVYESQPFQTVGRSYHTGPLKSERIASNSQGKQSNELPSVYGSVYESQPFQTVGRSYHTGPLKSERIASDSQGKQSNELPSIYDSVYESQPFQTVGRSYHTGPLKSERIASDSQGKQSNELPSIYDSVYESQPFQTVGRSYHTGPLKSERIASDSQGKQLISNHVLTQQAPSGLNKKLENDKLKINGHTPVSQPSHRNPLMMQDYDTAPPAINGQSTKQKIKAPAPRGILHKQRAPLPPSMNDDDLITFDLPPSTNKHHASNLKLSIYEDNEESES